MNFRVSICLLCMAILFSCQSDREVKPDVSDIDLSIDIKRFDRDLMNLDTLDMKTSLMQLQQDYPVFWHCFMEQVLGFIPQRMTDEDLLSLVKGFVSFPMVRNLYDESQSIAKLEKDFEGQFEEAFKYARYYFPEQKTPQLISYTSELAIGACTCDEDVLAFAWEFFLGSGSEYYPVSLFPSYIQQGMTKDHLIPKTMEAWVTLLARPPSGNTMLDMMIRNGKILYVLHKLLPDVEDHIIIDYTPEQLKWCEVNELNIYSHFISEELLYNSSAREYRKYVEYSPNSPGMPPESPGRTANFIGWRIVDSYMQNSKISPSELLNVRDAQSILEGARYKPRRN